MRKRAGRGRDEIKLKLDTLCIAVSLSEDRVVNVKNLQIEASKKYVYYSYLSHGAVIFSYFAAH